MGDPFNQHESLEWVQAGLWPPWPWLLSLWLSLLG